MTRIVNWCSQVLAVCAFSLRTIPQRRGPSLAAIVGIAGVVAVLVGVLSIAEGFTAAMRTTGPDDVAIVLRSGADSEMTSGLSRDEARIICDAPGIASGSAGPLCSAELFVMINLPKRSTGTDANVPLRGVGPAATAVRSGFEIVEGRTFEPGRSEVIVGAGASRAFAGTEVGSALRIGQSEWTVVGVFAGGSGAAESELWTDAAVLQPAYQRGDSFQSVLVRLESPEAFDGFREALAIDPRLKVKALRLSEFLAEQSSMLSAFIQGIGFFVAGLMALGAVFGALNTMYGAVAGRTREIATLRALGFGATPIVLSVVVESLALSLVGGLLGASIAYLLLDGFTATTINWQSFSQVAFAFAVTPRLLVMAILWATAMGLLGGLLPALRAARLPIAGALREA
ncbi:MAG TPA: ABC transporter permease [Phycisphaerales bacterium]|nr:ABC transporter permease [Phycisphaerales bacterium]HMP36547.1 ABC transporter permease [Phycisphaerales bacterium]